MAESRVYWTPSDRNFGVYNATAIIGGVAYTAFFTPNKERGRVDGVRYHLVMGVESAYRAKQPSEGMKLEGCGSGQRGDERDATSLQELITPDGTTFA